MKIISYNVNGIRAAITKGFFEWLEQANPDVVCLQEIKANADQLSLEDFENAGYPYHYWYSANKKGYSGVAIFSKTKPDNVVYGTGIEHMDFEGRNIRADFGDISVMSLYLPSGKISKDSIINLLIWTILCSISQSCVKKFQICLSAEITIFAMRQ